MTNNVSETLAVRQSVARRPDTRDAGNIKRPHPLLWVGLGLALLITEN
jgi:hypothetical protein